MTIHNERSDTTQTLPIDLTMRAGKITGCQPTNYVILFEYQKHHLAGACYESNRES